jgi:hypothetical protein
VKEGLAEKRRRFPGSSVLAVLLGVAYGIAMRLAMDGRLGAFELMSFSFLVLVPMAIGAIVVYFDAATTNRPTARAVFLPWIAIAAFLLTTLMLLLEGSICVVMVLPGFLLLSSGGGLIGKWLKGSRRSGGPALSAIALLPFLGSPLESGFAPAWEVHTIARSVTIDAAPEVVWSNITSVPWIAREEMSWGINDLLGLPRPLEARMGEESGRAVRLTRWERGISFREDVIASSPGRKIEWKFDFPPGSIPSGSLDEHVEMGGSHFKLDEGGYRLESLPTGGTELTLWTTYRISMRPLFYSRWWAYLVLGDFHSKLLGLMKSRSEALVGQQLAGAKQ